MTDLQPRYRDLASPANFDRFVNGATTPHGRQALLTQHAYDWHARKIFFEPYFRALVLHRCTEGGSLTDLQAAMASDPLYRLHQAQIEVSVPALSKANATRPVAPFLEMLSQVLRAIDRLPRSGKILRQVDGTTLEQIAELLDATTIFDATTFSLPPKIARWAQTGPKQAGFKLQLRLEAGYGGLDRLMFTSAKGNDNPYFLSLLDLEEGAGRIYLFDAGYSKLTTYDRIVQSRNHFVSTLSKSISYTVVEVRPLPPEPMPQGYVVHADMVVRLGAEEREGAPVYRLLDVTDSRGHRVRLLTDLLDEPVATLCLLRVYRWTIETVFRWLKCQLKMNQFISYSPRGVIVQVVVALIVYGLFVLYHQGGPLSIVRIRRQVKSDLHQALYEWGYQHGYQEALQQHAHAPPLLSPMSLQKIS